MKTPLDKKSTISEIEDRFDVDVERFSHLKTGQQAMIDAPVMLELISKLAVTLSFDASNLLDIRSGAGSNTIAALRHKPGINCDLVDLSMPMLERATGRLESEKAGEVHTYHRDFRDIDLPYCHYDIIIAAAVLHHLRDDADWEKSFGKIYDLLKAGGALFVSDIVTHEDESIQEEMWSRYGAYLEQLGGRGL